MKVVSHNGRLSKRVKEIGCKPICENHTLVQIQHRPPESERMVPESSKNKDGTTITSLSFK